MICQNSVQFHSHSKWINEDIDALGRGLAGGINFDPTIHVELLQLSRHEIPVSNPRHIPTAFVCGGRVDLETFNSSKKKLVCTSDRFLST